MVRVNDDCADVIAEYAVADVRTALALRAASRRWHDRVALRILGLLAVDHPELSPYGPNAAIGEATNGDGPAVSVRFCDTLWNTYANHALRVALSTEVYAPRIQRLVSVTACDVGLTIDDLSPDVFRVAAPRSELGGAMGTGAARRVAAAACAFISDDRAGDVGTLPAAVLECCSARLRRLVIPDARDAMALLARVKHPEAVSVLHLGRDADDEPRWPSQRLCDVDFLRRLGAAFSNPPN